MPELPEIEIVKKSLLKMINKSKIKGVKIYNNKLRYKISYDLIKQLKNEKILNISRRSKYLLLHFKNKFLLVHFGMTGKLLILRNKDKKLIKTSFYYDLNIFPKHDHIYLSLNNGLALIYNDVRKFGFLKVFKNKQIKKISFLEKLGVEPLSKFFNINYFNFFASKRNKNIKNLLMDQTFISGLGNIYVNESLFMSKIHPLKNCLSLNKREIKKLIFNIKKVLKLSISKGGSSIKDFKNAHGKKGFFQDHFKVYNRENAPCSRISCSGRIKKIFISNRSSFYCSKCQN